MKNRGDIIAIAIILLVIIIRFAPFLFAGRQILTDGWKSYYPWRASYTPSEIKTISYDPELEYDVWFQLVKKEIQAGRFPHWNPYSFCGCPLYANHLVPLFHIPFAIALLWPGELILTAYSFLLAIFGTLFFYWFLRNFGISIFGSLFGTMAYFLSGWLTYLYIPEVATLVWIPAILLFYDRFCKDGKLYNAGIGAFCVGQLLISGYPIFIAHFIYVMVIYAIWRRITIKPDIRVSFTRWALGALMIIVLGALISAVQNIPTYEFMKISNRGIASEKEKFETKQDLIDRKEIELAEIGQELGIKGLILDQIRKKSSIIVPAFEIHRTNNRNFVGPIVVLFGLIGLFCSSRKYRVLKIMFVIFAIFDLVAPVYIPVAKIVPLWSISIYIPREVFSFLLFFLAAIGVDTLGGFIKRSNFALVLCVLMLLITIGYISYNPILNASNTLFMWSKSYDSIFAAIYFVVAIALIILCAIKASGRTIRQSIISFAMTGFIIISLGAHYYIFQYFASPDPMPMTEDVKKIIEICKDGRIVRFDDGPQQFSFSERFDYVFPANIPAKYGIYDVFGYDSMILANYDKFLKLIDPGSIMWERAVSHYKDCDVVNKFDFLGYAAGVKEIITRGDYQFDCIPDINGTYKDYHGGVNVYSYRGYPLIRIMNKYKVGKFSDYDDLNEINYQKGWRNLGSLIGYEVVLLEQEPILKNGQKPTLPKWGVRQSLIDVMWETKIKRTPSSIEIDYKTRNDHILYIADTYHPQWRAKIDGKEVEILEANFCFRAVAVPEGTHTLEMWYDGIEVVVGGIISGIALLITLLISIVDIRIIHRAKS